MVGENLGVCKICLLLFVKSVGANDIIIKAIFVLLQLFEKIKDKHESGQYNQN